MILILYTTLYRTGGREMDIAAKLLAKEKARQFPELPVVLKRIESKREMLEAFDSVRGNLIREYHFIGHSGLYGPMYGTTKRPDQMSRAEWAELDIPFAEDAEAYFHCCRSARWFAPFFARRYGVPTYGNMLYTTFSHDPATYVEVKPDSEREDVYVVSTPGYKASGVRGYLRKRMTKCPTIPMTRFAPAPLDGDASYDTVAELYDQVFEDFRVRQDEWKWLTRHLRQDGRVLDIGCGNGALLLALAPLLREGVGVDVSGRMIEIARHRARGEGNLSFEKIEGPVLPFPDASFDSVVSMLSWRYLDWDPIVAEIHRVLKPGGQVLIVDMVVASFKPKVFGRVLRDKVRASLQGLGKPNFKRALKRLVQDPAWSTMLKHNPMRAEHEMRWYLPSRFPGGTVETLNRSARSEILAHYWESGESLRSGGGR